MANSSVDVLAVLAGQLSLPSNSDAARLLFSKEEDDCDFSSFPSLSLEESPGNHHRGYFTSRGDVETHVESLLSRPILWGKQDDDERSTGGLLVDPESDSLDEFFVESLEEVPKLMMNNFCTSFATLMNSRLRAYATFLARHALSLARCSKTEQEMEGVIGIEHKLETMLGIGSQVNTASVSSEFITDQEELPTVLPVEGDDQARQVSMPLKLKIHLTIALPHVKATDGNESMEVCFETTGKICGIFAVPSEASQEAALLRVAEVSLNMHELLTAMAGQASKVISCIVDMTNAAFTVPLPASPEEGNMTSTSNLPAYAVVLPDEDPEGRKRKNEDDEEAIVSLSPAKCASIVDCVIGELDDDLLTPRTVKKLKVVRPPLA